MEEDVSVAELISNVTELNEISLYFKNEDVDKAMALVIRMVAKPEIPAGVAARLVVQTQALSSKFSLMGKYYMLYDTEETKESKTRKKNTLLTLAAELEKLSNALKYLVKN
jgi:hypothetical protein